MNAIISSLKEIGCDVSSVTAAGRFANSFSNKEWPKNRFETMIKEEFYVDTQTSFNKEAEMLYRYMVIEAVTLANQKIDFTGETVLKNAQERVSTYFKNFPWNHPSHTSQLKKCDFDEDGNYIGNKGYDDTVPVEDIKIARTVVNGKTIKPKKGAKQLAAKAIYEANRDKSNKEIIAMFMSQLDMSKAGGTTYLFNLKKSSH